jgi:hypothetical protein
VRGSTTPIARMVAGDEYAPDPAPPPPAVAWTRSVYWSRPERERDDPYAWHPTELPPSRRQDGR